MDVSTLTILGGLVAVVGTLFAMMRSFRRDINEDVTAAISGVQEDVKELTAEIRRVEGEVDEVAVSVAFLRERTSNIEGWKQGWLEGRSGVVGEPVGGQVSSRS